VKFEPTIASVLPEYVKPERMIALTLTAATKNPKLFDCSMESVALALIQVAQWDLEIGTTAHLVPFGNTCTAIADWKGLVKLMIRSGHVKDVKARAVYKNEHFRVIEGLRADLEHVPSYDATARGELMAFYAVAFLARGGGTFEVMTTDDVNKIRARANSKNSDAWNNHYVEMGKKTAIRRLAKRMPQTPALTSAISIEDRLDAGDLLEAVQADAARLRQRTGIAPERPRQLMPGVDPEEPYNLDASGGEQVRDVPTTPAPARTPAQRARAEEAAKSADPYEGEKKSENANAPAPSPVRIPFNQGDALRGSSITNVATKDLSDAVRHARGEAQWAAFVEAADEELERRRVTDDDNSEG
jgi:recombination protein RecT